MLTALFLTHFVCSNFFTHVHYIDGKRVTHSHPYKSSSNHSHTAAQFHTIAVISLLLAVEALLMLGHIFSPGNGEKHIAVFGTLHGRTEHLTYSLRGPPVG